MLEKVKALTHSHSAKGCPPTLWTLILGIPYFLPRFTYKVLTEPSSVKCHFGLDLQPTSSKHTKFLPLVHQRSVMRLTQGSLS